ncbi:large ribosomal subunit protein bL20m-like isoform X2 [Achroia grisella]|uniref:large ribosomal subunit protein bL20m-like isoform X2 n=1 Tax=Achroia grisella TaxID=688607 RepID=UPI0027D26F51|nr:large ribosomal subunit protein bL20m-like isoform X2 [Achroia grisella]XP_059058921.1 large ribosomal subunit protein bL20m-like isoform X2 [Achroia grisella]
MVFLSVINWVRSRGPDEYWRKRKIFRLSAHYIGRRRNCYSVAVRNVHRALVYATKARKLKKADMKALWETRITAACEQHNMTYFTLKEGLDRANIMLDRKTISDLASWEPRTFECLAAVAKQKLNLDGFIDGTDKNAPTGVNLNLKDVMLDVWLKENKK